MMIERNAGRRNTRSMIGRVRSARRRRRTRRRRRARKRRTHDKWRMWTWPHEVFWSQLRTAFETIFVARVQVKRFPQGLGIFLNE